MPYEIREESGEFCVWKQGGEKMKCYPTKDEADKYLAALYANVQDAGKATTTSGYIQVGPVTNQTGVLTTNSSGETIYIRADEIANAPIKDETGDEIKTIPSKNPKDYLVVEDPEKSTTWHLQVKEDGTPNHRLMGAAWAALHEGFRGNKYQGPGKEEAIGKLRSLYESEGMPVPGGKSVDTDDILIEYGDAVKALGEGKVGGYLVRFTAPNDLDLDGDYFNKSTDYDLDEDTPTKSRLYYHHGLDEVIGKRKIGKGQLHTDDVGVWIEAQLSMRDEYEKAIYAMAEQGKLGWSSGTASHLVETEQQGKARWIRTWPLGMDASLTPTPAEPRNTVIPLKSMNHIKSIIMPDPKGETETAMAETNIKGEKEMTEEKVDYEKMVSEAAEKAAAKAIADFAQKLPSGPGTFQVTVAEEDRPFTELGDELKAVQVATISQGRQLDPRLKRLDIKQLGANELIGSEGGFLLEPTFAGELLKPLHEEGPFSSKVRKFPIGPNSNSLSVNAVDEASRATGSRWGGIQGYRLAEAGTKLPSQPTFRRLDLRLKKYAVLCYATDEMLADSTALASVIQQGSGEELSFMVNDDIFTGPGAAGPLGLMDGGALISVAAEGGQLAATIVVENIYKMWARLHPRSKSNAIWYINTDCWPQLFGLNQVVGLSGVPMFMAPGALPNTPSGSLLGRPIIESEFNETLGTVGDIVLADMSQYILIEKGGVQQASSIHVQFLTDQTVYRFVYRCDGLPAWATPLVPYKGIANTQSPFVALATR